jgi:cellulose 1,4-beta-cellobiosidase
LIHYDLPNRDCRAKASNGEICCVYNADRTCDYDTDNQACTDGLKEYETEYVDVFASIVAKYNDSVPMVLVIEPDSLPNMASNMSDPHCANSATAYKEGIKYAINKLSVAAPKASLYLDAAHGGWLGWSDNMNPFTKLVADMGVSDKIRGFSTNVANYQPLGDMCPWSPTAEPDRNDYCLPNKNSDKSCCKDPCKLCSQYNSGNNEMNYAQLLTKMMAKNIPGFNPKVIIDTGRNGVGNMRTDCANWCNARGAGLGKTFTTDTGSDYIDAFMWLKTPGETDGCTEMLPDGTACKRFDSFCGSVDSIGSRSGEPRIPEAGKWSSYIVTQLATNANPVPTPPTPTGDKYKCESGVCVVSPTGIDKNTCDANCTPPADLYKCESGVCVKSPTGVSKEICSANCTPPADLYKCESGVCVKSPTGVSSEICNANCVDDKKY